MSRLRGASRSRGARLAAGAAFSVLLLAGCGSGGGSGGGYGGGGSGDSGDSGGGGGGGMTLEITSPKDGATVETPFTIDLSSSEELGPTDTGKDHVHVYFDGNDQEYMVVEGDSVEVTDLPAGEHEIDASLRNADHSAAGVETQINVTVGSGGSTGDSTGDDGDSY
ncbi:hypothetical protein ACFWEJ_01330 [Promicromonospora sp. NPDC060204]|uniref:hypothetical protein n=1 Tax=Promicromonospora sp. NPDC060204 TaxID=3347071 RepID=UPI0036593D29